MTRLQRLILMAFYLSSRRRVLARQVAEQFAISLRTAYRDVKALQGAGFPVEGTAGDGYRVTQDAFLRPLGLTPDEAEALALAAKALGPSLDAGLRASLASAVTKLEAALGRPVQRRVQALLDRVAVGPTRVRQPALTGHVLEAIRDRRALRVTYCDTRDDTRTARTIEPLGLVWVGDLFWLLAYCRLRGDARIFRVDRLDACESDGETFEPRPGFSFAEILRRDGDLGQSLFR